MMTPEDYMMLYGELPSEARMKPSSLIAPRARAAGRAPRPAVLGGIPEDLGYEESTPEDMSEADIADLAQLGVLGEDLSENSRQMELAEGLRYAKAPEGRAAGRVFVAANPLEHLATGIDRYRGAKEMKRLEGERKDISGKQTEGRAKYWDLLRGKKRKDIRIDDLDMPRL